MFGFYSRIVLSDGIGNEEVYIFNLFLHNDSSIKHQKDNILPYCVALYFTIIKTLFPLILLEY